MTEFDKKRHDRWNQELKSVNESLVKIRSGQLSAGKESVYVDRQNGLVKNIKELESRYGEQKQPETKSPDSAENKYKIGATYKGGLKYLGGDPNSSDSWKQVQ